MEESRDIPVPPMPWSQLRDETLAEELQDFMAHDWRTAHLKLSMRVDGGVAHVRAAFDSEEERQRVRRLMRPAGWFVCRVGSAGTGRSTTGYRRYWLW